MLLRIRSAEVQSLVSIASWRDFVAALSLSVLSSYPYSLDTSSRNVDESIPVRMGARASIIAVDIVASVVGDTDAGDLLSLALVRKLASTESEANARCVGRV